MRFDDLAMPDSRAATAALEVASQYCPPALLNHSIRSFLWAASYAGVRDIGFDAGGCTCPHCCTTSAS
jgi:hypothetical protein